MTFVSATAIDHRVAGVPALSAIVLPLVTDLSSWGCAAPIAFAVDASAAQWATAWLALGFVALLLRARIALPPFW